MADQRYIAGDPNCPICVVWGAWQAGKGQQTTEVDAHRAMILGWWAAKSGVTTAGVKTDLLMVRGVCTTHGRMLEFLEKAQTEREMLEAAKESKS